jgi:sugar lactone lactonase YvrE
MLCGGWIDAGAQTAHFSGAQSIVVSNGLSTPHGVAVDASGNVYIADLGNNRILKETLSGAGYVESTVASNGLNAPAGVAVDASGNVFIADSANNRILKETLSGGTYTESVVPTTGLHSPLGIAVDQSGSLLITDSYNAQVVKETYSGGVYTQHFVLGGPTWPDGVAVDASGNIYVCAPTDDYVAKLTPTGSGYTLTHIGSMLVQPHGVAVDAAGNVYIADGSGNRILKEAPSGSTYTQSVVESGLNLPEAITVDSGGTLYFNNPNGGEIDKLSQSGANFGITSVGKQSSTVSLIFTFDTAGSIGTPVVVTQGIPNLDFTDAGTGTCTTNGTSHTYAIGDSCTVNVTFIPKEPGVRYGAAVLTNNSGTVIATGYAQGIGLGPQLSFVPGVKSQLTFPDVASPYSLASDAAGNLYIANAIAAHDPANSVVKETWNGSGYTQSTVATGFGYPTGIAVDGAGNIYVADQDGFTVFKETLTANGSYTQSIVDNTLGTVGGIAVDGAGNIYVGRGGIGVEKETLSGERYIRSEIFSTFYAESIAIDASGNLYFASTNNSAIVKEAPSSNGYVQSMVGSINPLRVAVDGVGNVYAATGFSNGTVWKEEPSGSSYVETELASGLDGLVGLTVDGNGSVYFSSASLSDVGKISSSYPSALRFATTAYGSMSTDSPQTVTIKNSGNAALSFPVLSAEYNPSIATSFSLNDSSASACPVVGVGSSSAATLAAGASCELAINFVPAAVGPISGSLVLTDDALNAMAPDYATQSISLSGTGTQATPTVNWATPAAVPFGTVLGAAQLNATASVPGTFSYSPLAGTVPGVGTQTLSASFTPTDSVDYTVTSATTSLVVNKATPSNTLVSSTANTFVLNSVTLTAAVVSAAGMPTGTVSFYDGTTLLGTLPLNSGTAAYTTSALTTGTHSITAVYSGDNNFSAVTSAAVAEIVEDFTAAPSSGGSTSATVLPGGQATYTLAMTPQNGGSFAAPITFAVTGLPAGATATFSPASIAAGAGATNVTLTVQLPSAARMESSKDLSSRGGMTVAFGLILLPLLVRRKRAQLGRIGCWGLTWILAGVGSAVLFATLAGCGGSSGSSSGTKTQSYTLTVTAMSGSLSHTTTLNLTVK